MPYTKRQEAAFRAAEHDPATRRAMGMDKATATKLAHEAASMPNRPAVRHDPRKLARAVREAK